MNLKRIARNPFVRILAVIAALNVFFLALQWIGNPYDTADDPQQAASSWMPPPPVVVTSTSSPPPGWPVIDFPPKLPAPDARGMQEVPTRYGLSYFVPSTSDWRPSNSAIAGWSDHAGTITTLGAVSDYRYGYCEDGDEFPLALIGARGRNGVDLETAAREQVELAERLYTDDSGKRPRVQFHPRELVPLAHATAVSYTATVSNISSDRKCQPTEVRLTTVAVPAAATAEVAIFMLTSGTDDHDSLDSHEVREIIESITKYNR
ncbi:hypothetical protein [Nocardia mangyaensis]|uniref:hypothetical protein n=1 Tax=Nocardia mangyaensis TaxID=2213200 RepID=UPI0026750313|nr:hypothetical protein [Nocardia mangyaensis]MDO3647971.1 hypothetical protein [Nocardia mangyaensis]